MTIETATRLVHLVALAMVGAHYFIPVGGHTCRGCLGYVKAALEIDEQRRCLGTPSTAPGCHGCRLRRHSGRFDGRATPGGSSIQPLGIDVGKMWRGFPASIASMAGEICAMLGSRCHSPRSGPAGGGTYTGSAYGVPSPAGQAACTSWRAWRDCCSIPSTRRRLAPDARPGAAGQAGQGRTADLLHTGGLPALFAFGAEMNDPGYGR